MPARGLGRVPRTRVCTSASVLKFLSTCCSAVDSFIVYSDNRAEEVRRKLMKFFVQILFLSPGWIPSWGYQNPIKVKK